MAEFRANRIHVDVSSSGTADFTVGSAVSTAYQSFSGASVTDNAEVYYTAYTATQFECGKGVYDDGTGTVIRTAGDIYDGSAGAGAKTNFSTNPRLFVGPLAESPGAAPGVPLSLTGTGHAGAVVFEVLPDSGASFTRIYDNGTVVVDADSGTGTYPLTIKYNGSDRFRVDFNGQTFIDEQSSGTGILNIGGGYLILNKNYMQFAEVTAPSSGGANTCRLFVEDNGAGKTRLMAIFGSGAAQQVAIEP